MSNGQPRELSFRAILLGSVLGVILAAANAYLGLYAGLTVSASIPAAVISMAILRGLLKTGTAVENNVVQTIAASGETLAAGVIFTVPALVLTQSWHQFHYWPTTLIAMCGGLLGILFMIPLRRAIIVEERELTFPEGTACAEILKAGEGGKGGRTITIAILLAGIYKFFSSGVSLFQGGVEAAFRAGQSLFYFGTETSLALLSVGYIVGPNVATLQFLGGVISWVVAIPVYSMIVGISPGEDLISSSWSLWKNQIRYMGVGAMAVGGLWTIWSVRAGLGKGIKRIFGKRVLGEVVARTDQDLSRRYLLPLLLVTIALIFGLYRHLTGSLGVGLYATFLIVTATFFFVAVASYLVGLGADCRFDPLEIADWSGDRGDCPGVRHRPRLDGPSLLLWDRRGGSGRGAASRGPAGDPLCKNGRGALFGEGGSSDDLRLYRDGARPLFHPA
ncbi:MAG: oligopeptide transporter, OPT family [Deltaproteobacteria bacterium]|nr:oligopeptide transporter, OPT family [Deltaproteobacteria bacterium]